VIAKEVLARSSASGFVGQGFVEEKEKMDSTRRSGSAAADASGSDAARSTRSVTNVYGQETDTMSALGALKLEQNFQNSVDELLKLCTEVTEEATTQLALHGKPQSEETSDPVREDMFRRKIEHTNKDASRRAQSSALNQTFNFDKLQKEAQDALLDGSNTKPITPQRNQRFSGEFSYSDLVAAPKRPNF